ncbi:MAG: electron transfer flavoprotein subunit alpha/FixB family protein [Deltaproteobacteria bacterium]|nr:MAG: electron transfer flavoprotein subunit alpha/FixB family protein [Deltaproteobacteria bacterium]
MGEQPGRVWVFGDYRNYFQNRVTLQLIGKAKELAQEIGTGVTVLVVGERVRQYAMEYVAHGADAVMVAEHPDLSEYRVETYTALVAEWVETYGPEILLAGATAFGRSFFPRLAKRLRTGLSADCVDLHIDPETKLLVQTTPAWGGELLAEVITPHHRPQMATVHPGVFEERPHDPEATGGIFYPEVKIRKEERIRVLRRRTRRSRKIRLEEAEVVVVGGRGLGSKAQFEMLEELAELLDGEVGATRPAIRAGWTEEERLLGQTGKSVRPKTLISVGTSGALQYTAGILGAGTIIAINRDPHAPIFKISDLGVVGDAKSVLPILLEELRKRL